LKNSYNGKKNTNNKWLISSLLSTHRQPHCSQDQHPFRISKSTEVILNTWINSI
jgi:hypothetical protein